jgi:hypothetical protein
MGRKRREHPSFDWTPIDDDNKELPIPEIHIRHTRLDLDASGASSSTTRFLAAPASPAKRSCHAEEDFSWNDMPVPLELNTTNYPLMDPAYEHFLDINEPGALRRKRTTEVSLLFVLLFGVSGYLFLAKDDPLRKWRNNDRDRYLTELIRLDE